MAAYDKPEYLSRALASIYRQPISQTDDVEVIVVDDRSPNDRNREVCGEFPRVRYVRVDGEPGYRNPARARNVAYRQARGGVVICQSDDTVHISPDCIEMLIADLTPGHFLIANVFNTDFSGKIVPGNLENPEYASLTVYTGPTNPRPFFFLGSLFRKDLYAVGGNDEEFTAPSYDDNWFADCLMLGLGLKPVYSTRIVGHHLQHKHFGTQARTTPSRALYRRKHKEAVWQASGGPWKCE
jgi:glycosyltransferase involved in cell wall biosynthesis